MENKKSFWASKAGFYAITAILYVVFFVIFVLLYNALSHIENSEYIALVIGAICMIFGWKALNKIRPDVFLIMPIIGWLIFFLVKGILSFLIGIFVMPYMIAKKVSAIIVQNVK